MGSDPAKLAVTTHDTVPIQAQIQLQHPRNDKTCATDNKCRFGTAERYLHGILLQRFVAAAHESPGTVFRRPENAGKAFQGLAAQSSSC